MNRTVGTFMGIAITAVVVATLVFGNMYSLLQSIASDITRYISQ